MAASSSRPGGGLPRLDVVRRLRLHRQLHAEPHQASPYRPNLTDRQTLVPPVGRGPTVRPMPDAVIVATGRTPIGRAFKGSLVECRPDDLAALAIKEVVAKVPQLDPAEIEDVILGCGQPGGESGFNIARVAALLAGIDAPGVTVNRYCSSSLQSIRMAAHAITAGEGDVFVSPASRRRAGSSSAWPTTARRTRCSTRPACAATSARRAAPRRGRAPSGLPDIYIAMGQTAENVAEYENVSREDDGRVRRPLAAAGRGRPGARLLRPRDHPGHHALRRRRHRGRRPPCRHHRREARHARAGVPARRQGHRRQRLPAQRRRRRRDRDVGRAGLGARASRRSPASCRSGVSALEPGDHGPRPDRGLPARPSRAPA